MTCKLNQDSCEYCQEFYCQDTLDEIRAKHAELTRAVGDAVNELERFVDEYWEVL